jgi:hypothetical protein
MELLFNKDSRGGNEIKELLGFIDGGFDFKNIKMDVRTASKDLIKIIGNDLYIDLLDIYTNGALDSVEEELLLSARYAIAFRAFSIYAVKTDLSKTTNGRKMRADGEEKTPWDWMIDRDNEAMERGYYKAVDELLEFLEEEQILTWINSQEYATMRSSVVHSTAILQKYYPQGNRFMLLQLQPGFTHAQKNDIEPRLTSLGLVSLVADLNSNSRALQLAQQACVNGGIAWGLRHLRVTIFPEGILQSYTSDRVSTKARNILEPGIAATTAQLFERAMSQNLLDLEEYLRDLNPPAADIIENKKPYRQGYIANDKFFST